MLRRLLRRRQKVDDADRLLSLLSEHIERLGLIRCPLVLVSQISRSGGSWMSQLFDHHPQIWAHPRELKIGYPRKWDWPDLSGVSSPQDVWAILRYKKADTRLGAGTYYKGSMDETSPILFSAGTQEQLFLELASRHKPQTERDWLDVYFTSFFYAWLDYQRRYDAKKFVTVFSSMLSMEPHFMAKFRAAYPDGYLISIIREPLGWYASVKGRALQRNKVTKHMMQHYAGPAEAERSYLENVEAMRHNSRTFGHHFILVDYDAMVADTEKEMRAVAARIGIDWHDCLTRQTFNGMPIKPNTSFQGESVKARSSLLPSEDVARIKDGSMMAAYRAIRAEFGT
jgi:Sulfotransferase family